MEDKEDRYVVIGLDSSISKPVSKRDAIDIVKMNYNNGISSYIVSQEEGEEIRKEGVFNIKKYED